MMGQVFMKFEGYKSWDDYLLNVESCPTLDYQKDAFLFGICGESSKLMLPKESVIAFHKRKLGKQKFCWTTSFNKNYIWELAGLRIFVNKDGRNIEILSPATESKLVDGLNVYIKFLGITLSLEELYHKNYKFVP